MEYSQPPIIFISLENWDDIWRRNQFVCAELARRSPDRQILFVGLPRDLSRALRTLKFSQVKSPGTYSVDGFPNIVATHALKLAPDSLALGRIANEAMLRRHVQQLADKLNMRQPVLWINDHSAHHMVGKMGEAAVIYDVTDDWTALSQSTALSERIAYQDAELCHKADAVIVCSERLLEMKQKLSDRVHLINNGVDASHYATVSNCSGSVPLESHTWGKPVFGYTGTVHPDRVDVDLVAAVSDRLKREGNGSLVFVGPNHLPASSIDDLTRHGNVFFAGPVPYRRIPEYMRAFDVCIVPHRMSAFTESLNPIKLWEYLAAGKPIVATDIAGFREYPHLVRLARTSDEFTDAAWSALAEGDSKTTARKQEAYKHSWKIRVDDIERVFLDVGQRSGLTLAGAAI